MRKSRFTEKQIITVPREAERTTVAEAAKKHKVSEPTIYAWRKHFGQLNAADVRRLKSLEPENSRVKKLLAESALDIEVFKETTSPHLYLWASVFNVSNSNRKSDAVNDADDVGDLLGGVIHLLHGFDDFCHYFTALNRHAACALSKLVRLG